jgi:hypothetical protein
MIYSMQLVLLWWSGFLLLFSLPGSSNRAMEHFNSLGGLSPLEVIRRDSVRWSKAGVTADFLHWEKRLVGDTLSDISLINRQLGDIALRGGGTLLIPRGRYELHEVVRIPSGVSLVGLCRDSSIIEIKLREVFEPSRHGMPPMGNSAAFLFEGSVNASIENLTLIYNPVNFEPLDFEDYHHPWVKEVFHVDDPRATDLFVTTIWFENARNCMASRCNILQAGNDPIRIQNSQHITCCHNLVDRAFNKAAGGAGYYNIMESSDCLIYKETVRRIRHLSIHYGSSYNVIFDCDLQADVNFHNGDKGHNLIENNRIFIPNWHSWRCFGTGSPTLHKPPGSFNVLFRNQTDYKGTGPEVDAEILYFMSDFFPSKEKGESKFQTTPYASEFTEGIFNSSERFNALVN